MVALFFPCCRTALTAASEKAREALRQQISVERAEAADWLMRMLEVGGCVRTSAHCCRVRGTTAYVSLIHPRVVRLWRAAVQPRVLHCRRRVLIERYQGVNGGLSAVAAGGRASGRQRIDADFCRTIPLVFAPHAR